MTRRMEPDIRLDTVWSYSYTVSTVYNYLLKLPVDNRIEHGVYDGKELCNMWEVIELLGGIELPAQGRHQPLNHVNQEPVCRKYLIEFGKNIWNFW